MGRPPLPKGESKAAQIGVRLNPEGVAKINEMAERSGQTKAEVIREAAELQIQNPPIWVKSKWKVEDLNEQLIEFRLKSKVPQGIRVVDGVGLLRVRKNPRGEIAVDIFIDQWEMPNKGVTTRIWLSQEAVDRIEPNPNQGPAKFRLLT